MRKIVLAGAFAALVALLGLLGPAAGQNETSPGAASPGQDARIAEYKAAWEAAMKAGTRGPADVTMIDQAMLKLPADYFFVPRAEGTRLMRSMGNTVHDPNFVGLIIGTHPSDHWLVVANYVKEGYVKDDEAKDWNADQLLQNLKDGTEETNKDRVARGFPEFEVLGWVEKPTYDDVTHRLVWSIAAKDKGAPASDETDINYNTYALGRDGYFSLNLLTSQSRVSADKGAARELLAALAYNSGKRYEDFNASTDHIAEYGIAALIGGVVAKKLGLLALIGLFVLKFAKVIGVAALAFGAGIWNFFRRKPKGTVS